MTVQYIHKNNNIDSYVAETGSLDEVTADSSVVENQEDEPDDKSLSMDMNLEADGNDSLENAVERKDVQDKIAIEF